MEPHGKLQRRNRNKVAKTPGTEKEGDIQRAILEYLSLKGYYSWRNYVGPIVHGSGKDRRMSANPARGMPDIMGIMPDGTGRLFAIEVKTKKGIVSAHQKERILALNAAGALAFIARSLDDVVIMLERGKIPFRAL